MWGEEKPSPIGLSEDDACVTLHPVTASFHASLARRVWSLVSESDADSLRALFAPDVEWRTYSSGFLNGEIRGPDAVVDLFARAGELTDDLQADLIDVFASDRGAILYYRIRALRSTNSLDIETLLVLEIDEGLITSVLAMPLDASHSNEFWIQQ